ncbi:MAG: helix-hairpin-helix domain-containing protein [Candidatus Omnitrophica bacterium]|nr:helix-hairpin-helix domain-containing protein [Candidatus Omnitrophota bacterium]
MWPFSPQERQAALFAVLILITGISFKLIFVVLPPSQMSLRVLDDSLYHPKININTATYAELAAVRHLGPASAARIINYRKTGRRVGGPDELAVILKRKPAVVRKFSGAFKWKE